MSKTILSPSILSGNFASAENSLKLVCDSGAKWLHLDVMDGHFVPNITFGPKFVKDLRPLSKIFFDVHLMLTNPNLYIEQFASSGADAITIHIEADCDIKKTCSDIRSKGIMPGLSINPETDIKKIFPYLKDFDLFLIMGVHPGFGGQSLIDGTFDKISLLKKEIEKLGLKDKKISVDGGIKESNFKDAINAGANVIVMGSAFFASEDQKGLASQFS